MSTAVMVRLFKATVTVGGAIVLIGGFVVLGGGVVVLPGGTMMLGGVVVVTGGEVLLLGGMTMSLGVFTELPGAGGDEIKNAVTITVIIVIAAINRFFTTNSHNP
jgi:hypothetical protein